MLISDWICHIKCYGNGMEDVIGGNMKEIMMEYGGTMVGVVGSIGFLFLMQEIIWGEGGFLPELIRIAIGGGM